MSNSLLVIPISNSAFRKQVVEALQVADVSTHVETRLVEGDEEMTRALEMVSTPLIASPPRNHCTFLKDGCS